MPQSRAVTCLWFLHLAAEQGHVVDRYADNAIGTIQRDATGVTWISEVDLRPTIEWAGEAPSSSDVEALHHASHDRCFIANSVRSKITVHAL